MSTCIACGCTDERACPGGCAWVQHNRKTGRGLCSQCDTSEHRRAYRAQSGQNGKTGKRSTWTPAEVKLLCERYPDTPTKELARELERPLTLVYQTAIKMGLKKSAAYLASPHACRLRRGDNVGAAYRFRPGHVPKNKGLRRPGWHRGRMRETQFKKGQTSFNWKPIGSERMVDGYRYTKISDIRKVPWTRNWKQTHWLLWEKHYGPIPPGYSIKFIDGDKTNVVIGNLCLVSRQDLMRLNTWHNYPHEIGRLVQLRGAIKRHVNKRLRHEEQNRRSP